LGLIKILLIKRHSFLLNIQKKNKKKEKNKKERKKMAQLKFVHLIS
jgi:hypothetical protein